MHYLSIHNNQSVPVSEIPEISYNAFLVLNTGMMVENSGRHCANYFGYPEAGAIKLICCIADDEDHLIHLSSCVADTNMELASFTAKLPCFEKFEREIHENFGIHYTDHPWLKPVRFAYNRAIRIKALLIILFIPSIVKNSMK